MVVDRIQKNYGIDRFQRPLLPFFRHRQDLIRDPAYRSVRHRQPVDILNIIDVSRPPEYASTTFLTSDIGTASVQTNFIYFSISLVQFQDCSVIIQALRKCVKSILHIAAI